MQGERDGGAEGLSGGERRCQGRAGGCPRGLGGGQEVWAEEMVKCSAPQWECWRDPLCLLG